MKRTHPYLALPVVLILVGCSTGPKPTDVVLDPHPAVLHRITSLPEPDEIPSQPDPNIDEFLRKEPDRGDLAAARRQHGSDVPGIRVKGEVPRPGWYVLHEGMSVAEAVRLAGVEQPGPDAKVYIRIQRGNIIYSVNPFGHNNARLRNGDVVDVTLFRMPSQDESEAD